MDDELKPLRDYLAAVRAECDRLEALVADPHPGLMTWNMMVGKRISAIAATAARRPT